MTREEVEVGIAQIRALAGDPEAAHGAEDMLWQIVLEAIRDGKLEGLTPAEAAGIAVQSAEIRFSRWCA
jgi:hypothetical protein